MSLTAVQAQAAVRDGSAMARRRGMYDVHSWVIFQTADPLRATHGHAGVDAVIVETPFERVRYQAFLYTLQGTHVTPSQTQMFRKDALGRLGFLVYAHSKTEQDRGFLHQFRPATLTAGSLRLQAPAGETFGPSSDFYDVGTFREERWVGSFSYRFAVANCIDNGTLDFSDGYGGRYHVRFDLSKVPE